MEINYLEACEVSYEKLTLKFNEMTLDKRITLLVGSNGCGKSTLLKMISGVFSKPLSNSYRFSLELPTYPLDVTVKELLNVLTKYDRYADTNVQVKLIELFDFSDYLFHKCTELSKGNRMKLSLILTLQAKVNLYLLDEPFSGLDEVSKKRLIKYIEKGSSQYIITTHLNTEFSNQNIGVIHL